MPVNMRGHIPTVQKEEAERILTGVIEAEPHHDLEVNRRQLGAKTVITWVRSMCERRHQAVYPIEGNPLVDNEAAFYWADLQGQVQWPILAACVEAITDGEWTIDLIDTTRGDPCTGLHFHRLTA